MGPRLKSQTPGPCLTAGIWVESVPLLGLQEDVPQVHGNTRARTHAHTKQGTLPGYFWARPYAHQRRDREWEAEAGHPGGNLTQLWTHLLFLENGEMS